MLFNTFNADDMNIYLMGIFYSTYRDLVISITILDFIVFFISVFITNIRDLHDYGYHIENVI